MNRRKQFLAVGLILIAVAIFFWFKRDARQATQPSHDLTKAVPASNTESQSYLPQPATPEQTNIAAVTNPVESKTDHVVPEAKSEAAPGISGKIILKGTPPPERNIALTPDCGPLHPAVLKTRFYVAGEDGALADVFIYIKDGLAGKAFAPPAAPVLLDQVSCEYTPYIVGLQTGQKLIVRNSDPLLHNVHSLPKVAGNQEANKAQVPKSSDLTFAFENPELFLTFKCDVHPWMFGYVCVVDNPFFAITGKDGTFILKNIPPGKYVVEAVHRKAGKQSKEITIGEGEAKSLDFTFELPGQ